MNFVFNTLTLVAKILYLKGVANTESLRSPHMLYEQFYELLLHSSGHPWAPPLSKFIFPSVLQSIPMCLELKFSLTGLESCNILTFCTANIFILQNKTYGMGNYHDIHFIGTLFQTTGQHLKYTVIFLTKNVNTRMSHCALPNTF